MHAPAAGARSAGCCGRLRLNEDNSRFVLLGAALLLYLLAGAALFQWAERDHELNAQRAYRSLYEQFRRNLTAGGSPSLSDVERLLAAHLTADRLGLLHHRAQWDLAGSFHFCCTVVSTIGWGWTAPQTTTGRVCLILYGILGCAGGILFFNLFLERFITLLSHVMRLYHRWQLERQPGAGSRPASRLSRPDSGCSQPSCTAKWKPSVYWVLLYLLVCTSLVLQLGAALYAHMERWDYVRALYYTFVSFATIGFGDMVAGIRPDPFYGAAHWYGVANFTITVVGVCCMYSLFNIVSIIIKQLLNYLIRRADGWCVPSALRPLSAKVGNSGGRLASLPTPRRSPDAPPLKSASSREELDAGAADGVIFPRELLHANRVSLAVMQKRLYESALQSRASSALASARAAEHELDMSGVNISSLGSVAIASKKLDGED
ncbi:potassium channel subfamily K member 13-like [Amphibalanus amphitrite]|uniref:potassium channel subfamily K member 13-like n=1 Tax=Amphibalanus amphitrite TaxID=1232801 RepID=UPI001C90AAA7|nr:potassium channel subfamily K member 13-like [Amphibalanus amphitrite]